MDLSDFDQTQAIITGDEESDLTDELQPNEVQKPAGYLKVLLQRGLKESVHPLYDGDNIIGRNADSCHICIPSKSLSKEHACIQIINGSHLIFDKGSLNKTHRGKLLLSPEVRYELKNNDEITFADVRCVYLVPKELTDTVAESGSETDNSDNLLLHHEVTLEDSGAAGKETGRADKSKSNGNDEDSEDSVLPPTQVFEEKSDRKGTAGVLAKDSPECFPGKNADVEEATKQTMLFLESESEEEEDLVIKKPTCLVEETFFCEDSDPDSSKDQEVLGVATQAYFNAECSDDSDEEVLKSDLVGAATQVYATGANKDGKEDADQDLAIKTVPGNTLDDKEEPDTIQPTDNRRSKRNGKEIHKFEGSSSIQVSEMTATQIFEADSDSAEDENLFAMSTLACDPAGGDESENEGKNSKGYAGENEATQAFDSRQPTLKAAEDPDENGNIEQTSCPPSRETKEPLSPTVKSSSTESMSPELPTQVLEEVTQEKSAEIDSDVNKTFDVRDAQTMNIDDAVNKAVKSDEISEGNEVKGKDLEALHRPTLVLGETIPISSDSEDKPKGERHKKLSESKEVPAPVVSNRLSTRKGRSRAHKTTPEDSTLSSSEDVSCGENNVTSEKSVLENCKSCESESELDASTQEQGNPKGTSPNTRKLKTRGLHLRKGPRTGAVGLDEPSATLGPSDEPTQAYGMIEAESTQVYETDTDFDQETSKVDEPTQAYADESHQNISPESTIEDQTRTKVTEVVETQVYDMNSDDDEDISRVDEPTQAYETDVDATQAFDDDGVQRGSRLEDPTQKYDSEEEEDTSSKEESEKHKRDEESKEVPDESCDDSDLEDQPLLRVNENNLIDNTQQLGEEGESEKERKEESNKGEPTPADDLSVKGSPLRIRNEDTNEVAGQDTKVDPISGTDELAAVSHPPKVDKSPLRNVLQAQSPLKSALVVDKLSPMSRKRSAASKHVAFANVDQANEDVDTKVEEESQEQRELFHLGQRGKKNTRQAKKKKSEAQPVQALEHLGCESSESVRPSVASPSPTRQSPKKLIIEGSCQEVVNEVPAVVTTREKRGRSKVKCNSEEKANESVQPSVASPSSTRQSPRKLILEGSCQEDVNEIPAVVTREKRGRKKIKCDSEENATKEDSTVAPTEDFEPVIKKGKRGAPKAVPGSNGEAVITSVRSSRRSQVKSPQRSRPGETIEPMSETSSEHEPFTAVKSKEGSESKETASIASEDDEMKNDESDEAKQVVETKRKNSQGKKKLNKKESAADIPNQKESAVGIPNQKESTAEIPNQKESTVEIPNEMASDALTVPRGTSRGRRVSFQPAFLKDFETDCKSSNRGKSSAANKNSPGTGEPEKVDDVTANTDDESIRGRRRKGKVTTSTGVEPIDQKEVLRPMTGKGRTKKGLTQSTEISPVARDDADTTELNEPDNKETVLGEQDKVSIESKVTEQKTAESRVKSTRKRGKNTNGDASNVQNEEKQDNEKLKDQAKEECPESDGGANDIAEPLVAVKRARRGQQAASTVLQATTEQDPDFKVLATNPRRKSVPAQKSQSCPSLKSNSKASVTDDQSSSEESIKQQVTAKTNIGRGRPRKSEVFKADAKNDFSTSEKEMNTVESVSEDKPPMTPTSKRKASGTVEVAETPSKRLSLSSTPKRQNKEENAELLNTPTLRKSTTENKPKVMFTGVIDEQGEKIVRELGGEIASSIHECSHLITDKVRRTVKFLSGLSKGLPIVSPQWLDSSKRAGTFLDGHKYLVSDEAMEKQYKFVLASSISKASHKPVFQGFKVHVSKSVHPDPAQMQEILQCAGAKYLKTMPKKMTENTVVVSCPEDEELCQPAIKAGIPVVEAEFVLTGILRQEVDLKSYSIFTAAKSSSTVNSEPTDKRRSKKK